MSIRVAASSPTLWPEIRATANATRDQCSGVRPTCLVPSGRTTSRSRLRASLVGVNALVADKGLDFAQLVQAFGRLRSE